MTISENIYLIYRAAASRQLGLRRLCQHLPHRAAASRQLGLRRLCQHILEHNRHLKESGIMPAKPEDVARIIGADYETVYGANFLDTHVESLQTVICLAS